MDSLDVELKAALERRVAQGAEPQAVGETPHPTPEQLATYHAGELGSAEEEALREHLIWCRECTALVLGLEDLGRASDDDAPGLEESSRSATRWFGPLPKFLGARPQAVLGRLAAILLLTVLGLSLWIVRLSQTVDRLSQPQINVAIQDLYLSGSPRSTDDGPDPAPAADEPVTLVLHPPPSAPFADYLLIIEDGTGTEVWRRTGLSRSPWDTFTLVLPGGFLAPGEYRLLLFGLDGERREALETLTLRLADR